MKILAMAILLSLLLVLAAHARSKFLPTMLPYSCDTIRLAVDTIGMDRLKAIARARHITITAAQRQQALKCLK